MNPVRSRGHWLCSMLEVKFKNYKYKSEAEILSASYF